MQFTWAHVFYLAKQIGHRNYSRIAERLDVHRSTISNLKNGKQKSFNKGIDEIYEALFDPTKKGSPAYRYKDNEIGLLIEMKVIIYAPVEKDKRVPEFGKDIKGLEGLEELKADSYKPFVFDFLSLAKNNEPPREKPKSIKNSSSSNDINAQMLNQTQAIPLSTIESIISDCSRPLKPIKKK